MTATVRSAAVVGVEAIPIWVEVDVARGLPHFNLVGLPDSSVRESRERVRAALRNAGFSFPIARLTVNLAPSHIRKAGSAFDLPIALGILAAQGIVSQQALKRWTVLGELALDGRVRPVPGVLCTALDLLRDDGNETALMLPAANAHEVGLVPGLKAVPVHSLQHAVQIVRQGPSVQSQGNSQLAAPCLAAPVRDPVIGQHAAKRGLEIALAGGHHALLVGPPGTGKTLLGERLTYIVPPLTKTEMLEVNRIYSAAGLIQSAAELHTLPPVRAPHHTATARTVLGGGTPPVPGEISLAHRGILLLDEMPLFRRSVLEAIGTPLEHGVIRHNYGAVAAEFPSRFSLIGTANPCPCGWLGDETKECRCTPADIMRYRRRLSGPLLDRIDIVLEVGRPAAADIEPGTETGESIEAVRNRIAAARKMQRERNDGELLNGMQNGSLSELLAALPREVRSFALQVAQKYELTVRGVHRMLRVARTIADLEESRLIETEHIAEAAAYRVPFDWLSP